MHATFKQLRLGAVFQVNKYDLTQWIKTSTKTARLLENNKVFYFQQKELVFALHFLNTQDTIRG